MIFKKTMLTLALAAAAPGVFATEAAEEPLKPEVIVDQGFTTDAAYLAKDVEYSLTNGENAGFFNSNKSEEALAYTGHLTAKAMGAKTRLTGLYANGSTLTNKGSVTVTADKAENRAVSWQQKAMLSQNGGTAVNEGEITVNHAYGMTVGTSTDGQNPDTNTIVNAEGRLITVNNGVAMEAGAWNSNAVVTNDGRIVVADVDTETDPKDAFGIGILVKDMGGTVEVKGETPIDTMHVGTSARISNNGTITVGKGGVGISVEKGDKTTEGNLITNRGTIDAANGAYAIRVTNGTTANTIHLAKDSQTLGKIMVGGVSNQLIVEGVEQTLDFEGVVDSVRGAVRPRAAGAPAPSDADRSLLIRGGSNVRIEGNPIFELVGIDDSTVTFGKTAKAEGTFVADRFWSEDDFAYLENAHSLGYLSINNSTVTNEGVIKAYSVSVNKGGKLVTDINLDEGNAIVADTITVNKGGELNLVQLNSGTEKTAVLLEEGTLFLQGGALTVADKGDFTGDVKIGRSKSKGATFGVAQGTYSFGNVAIGATLSAPDYVSYFTVGMNGDVTVKGLDTARGTTNITGKLTVEDVLTNAYVKNAVEHVGKISVNAVGELDINLASIGMTADDEGTYGIATAEEEGVGYFKAGSVANKGVINLSGFDGKVVTTEEFKTLGSAIAALLQTEGSEGVVNLGDIKISDLVTDDGKITQDNLGNIAAGGVTNDDLMDLTVSEVNSSLSGSFGAVEIGSLPEGADLVDADKTLILNGSSASETGILITDAEGNAAAASVAGTLTVKADEAEIGAVSGTGTFNAAGSSLTATGDMTVGEVNIASGLLTMGDKPAAEGEESARAAIETGTLGIAGGASLDAGSVAADSADIAGSAEATDFTAGELNVTAEGTLSAKNLTVTESAGVVGLVETEHLEVLDGASFAVGSNEGAGRLKVGTLASGRVFLDPLWDEGGVKAWGDASQASFETIAAGAGVEVGRASFVAVNASLAEARAGFEAFGLSLNENTAKAAAYVKAGAAPIQGSVWVTGAAEADPGLAAGAFVGENTAMVINTDEAALDGSVKLFEGDFVNNGTVYFSDIVLGESIQLGENVQEGENAQWLFDASRLEKGVLSGNTFEVVYNDEAAEELSGMKTFSLVKALYENEIDESAFESNSFRFHEWLLEDSAGTLSNAEAVKVANDAAKMGVTIGVQSVTMDAMNAFAKSIGERTSVLAAGTEGINVWADVTGGRYQAKKLYDGAGYASDIYAGIFGADTTVSCGARVGAAVTFGTADTESKNTLTATDTDSDFWGLSLYAGKRFGDANVSLDLGYLAASNDVTMKQSGFGKVAADTDAVTFGVRGEYLFEVQDFSIVPHVGLRWTKVSTDDFELAYRTQTDDMNVFQMPIGVTVAGSFEKAGWTFAPAVDLSVVPAFGDKDADTKLGITGISATQNLSVQAIDDAPVQAEFKLAAEKDNLALGISWKVSAGSDSRLDNAFKASVRYTF